MDFVIRDKKFPAFVGVVSAAILSDRVTIIGESVNLDCVLGAFNHFYGLA